MRTIIISTVLMMVGLSSVYFIVKTSQPKVEVTTAQCPMQPQVTNKEFISIEPGYSCEREGDVSDLLQPSGLWVNVHFSCWKLKTHIEEYCKSNQCSRNNP